MCSSIGNCLAGVWLLRSQLVKSTGEFSNRFGPDLQPLPREGLERCPAFTAPSYQLESLKSGKALALDPSDESLEYALRRRMQFQALCASLKLLTLHPSHCTSGSTMRAEATCANLEPELVSEK